MFIFSELKVIIENAARYRGIDIEERLQALEAKLERGDEAIKEA